MIRRIDPARWTTISILVIALLSMSLSRHKSNNNMMGESTRGFPFVVAVKDLESLGHCQKSGCRDSGDVNDAKGGDAAASHHSSGTVGGGGKKYVSPPSSNRHGVDERRSTFGLFVEFVCVALLVWLVLSASGILKAGSDDGGGRRGSSSSSLLPPIVVCVGAMVDRLQRTSRRGIGVAFDGIGAIAFALWSSLSSIGRFFGGEANNARGGKGRRGGGSGGTAGRRVHTTGVRGGYVSQDSVASLGSLIDLIGTSENDSGFFPDGRRGDANEDVELGRVAASMRTSSWAGKNDQRAAHAATGPRPRIRRIPSNASSIASYSSCHSYSSYDSGGGSSTWSMGSASTDGTDGYSSDDDDIARRRASWNTSDAVVAAEEEEEKKEGATRAMRRRRRRRRSFDDDSEGKDTVLSKFVGYLSSGGGAGRGGKGIVDPPSSSSIVGRRRSLDGGGGRHSIDDRGDGEMGGEGRGGIAGHGRAKRRSTLDTAPPSKDDILTAMYALKSGGGEARPLAASMRPNAIIAMGKGRDTRTGRVRTIGQRSGRRATMRSTVRGIAMRNNSDRSDNCRRRNPMMSGKTMPSAGAIVILVIVTSRRALAARVRRSRCKICSGRGIRKHRHRPLAKSRSRTA